MRQRSTLLAVLVAALALALPSAALAHRHHRLPPPLRLATLVTLDQPSGDLLTRTPITFSGSVVPDRVGDRAILQRQVGLEGDRWRTIDAGRIGPGSTYAIVHGFRQPDDITLRVIVRGDRRHLRGESSPISIVVQQAQLPGFTIGASATTIDFGSSTTITGTLTDGAATSVTLYGRALHHGRFRPLAAGTTDAGGNYSFVQSPTRNAIYKVRATTDARRHTAPLFVGVHDVLSIAPSASTATVGDVVTFTGSVQPDKTGHVIVLQRLDSGIWHSVAIGRVGAGSAYSLSHTLQTAGSVQFRTLVPGGPVNQRGVSSAVTLTVNPAA